MTVRDRIAYLVAGHGPTVALALVVLGAFALGVGVSEYTTPATTEVTDRTNPRTFATELDSSAVVTGNTSLYERGTRLTDPPVYLADATPVLDLALETRVPEDATVTLDRELRLVYVARRGEDVFWRNATPLAADQPSVTDGNDTLRADLDARRVRRTLSTLRDEVGSAGTVAARLELRVTYRTDDASGTLEATAPIRFERDAYTVGAAADERTHATPVTRTVTVPAGDRTTALLAVVGGGLGVVGGAVAGAVYWRRYRDVDPEDLALRIHRRRYAEWISTGTAPVAPDATVVEVDSLEDLVDVAIDSDARAIHDRDRGAYVVFHEGVVYRFDPGGSTVPGGEPDGSGPDGSGSDSIGSGGDPEALGGDSRRGVDEGPAEGPTPTGGDSGPPASDPPGVPADGRDGSGADDPGPSSAPPEPPAEARTTGADGPERTEARGDGGVPGSESPGPDRPADPLGYDVAELRDLAAGDPPGDPDWAADPEGSDPEESDAVADPEESDAVADREKSDADGDRPRRRAARPVADRLGPVDPVDDAPGTEEHDDARGNDGLVYPTPGTREDAPADPGPGTREDAPADPTPDTTEDDPMEFTTSIPDENDDRTEDVPFAATEDGVGSDGDGPAATDPDPATAEDPDRATTGDPELDPDEGSGPARSDRSEPPAGAGKPSDADEGKPSNAEGTTASDPGHAMEDADEVPESSGVAEAVANALDPERSDPDPAGRDSTAPGQSPGSGSAPTVDPEDPTGSSDAVAAGTDAGEAWFRQAATGRVAAGSGDGTAGSEWVAGPRPPGSGESPVFASDLFAGAPGGGSPGGSGTGPGPLAPGGSEDSSGAGERPSSSGGSAGSSGGGGGSDGVAWGDVPDDDCGPSGESGSGSGPDWQGVPEEGR